MTEQERKNLVVRVKNNKYLTRPETDYIVNALEEVQKYREIGTLEECRASMEKQKPHKWERGIENDVRCPFCGTMTTKIYEHRYCSFCGQRLE